MIDIIGHEDEALILQKANEATNLADEGRPIGLVTGKAVTATAVLLETSDDSVIDGCHRDALLLNPE
ncbi:hypothetical protein J2Y58_003274 [Sphingomonas sp. BE138]|nr:hypothetical protein [Sphingomonas sp. BE138]